MTKDLTAMLKELGDNNKLGINWYWKFKKELELSHLMSEGKGYQDACDDRDIIIQKSLEKAFTND